MKFYVSKTKPYDCESIMVEIPEEVREEFRQKVVDSNTLNVVRNLMRDHVE